MGEVSDRGLWTAVEQCQTHSLKKKALRLKSISTISPQLFFLTSERKDYALFSLVYFLRSHIPFKAFFDMCGIWRWKKGKIVRKQLKSIWNNLIQRELLSEPLASMCWTMWMFRSCAGGFSGENVECWFGKVVQIRDLKEGSFPTQQTARRSAKENWVSGSFPVCAWWSSMIINSALFGS